MNGNIKEFNMNLSVCCLKALKHGKTICPVCQQVLLPFNPTTQLKIQFKEKKR